MEQNIETKGVQRTEYLDKNGLDMLWAKVKENTHNQVEVERNRAVAKENSIIDTKADKSALDNYVLTTALAEYAKKTELPTAATKESLGVVKVGDGLNITDGAISVDPEYLVDMMSYGVEWDTTVADPACTRLVIHYIISSFQFNHSTKGAL